METLSDATPKILFSLLVNASTFSFSSIAVELIALINQFFNTPIMKTIYF